MLEFQCPKCKATYSPEVTDSCPRCEPPSERFPDGGARGAEVPVPRPTSQSSYRTAAVWMFVAAAVAACVVLAINMASPLRVPGWMLAANVLLNPLVLAPLVGVAALFMIRPRSRGAIATVSVFSITGVLIAFAALVLIALPAIEEARREAKFRVDGSRLRFVGLAFQEFHDTLKQFPHDFNKFPAASRQSGEPLLSWRVALLPFIQERELYEQFRRDEPWDSEHNMRLLHQMPDLFRNAGDDRPGMTSFLMIRNLDRDGKPRLGGLRRMDLSDGAANTIAVVRVGPDNAVPWTKPDGDFILDPEDPLAAFGADGQHGILALYYDGSVRRLPPDVSDDQLRALFTAQGGETIEKRSLRSWQP